MASFPSTPPGPPLELPEGGPSPSIGASPSSGPSLDRGGVLARDASTAQPEAEVLVGELVDAEEVAPLDARSAARAAPPDDEGELGDEDDDDDRADGEADSSDSDPDAEVLEGEVLDDPAFDDASLEAPFGEPTQTSARIGRGELAPLDPLQAYMRDVQRHALLTPEQTHDLAVKYVETGDVEAARKLVTANLRLVVKIAYDYRRAYRNILDLIQEGNIGLMQAVKKYDPYKGVKLSSYSAWWIRAYILRFVLNNWRLVKLGTTQAQRKLFFNLRKEKARLSAMGIEPTPELIAHNLDVTTEEVVHMDRRLGARDLSLDAPVGNGDDAGATARIERMASDIGPADELLAHAELQGLLSEKIHEFGETLQGKDEIIFRERLMAEQPKTLQELGAQFGVSRERVRQIEKRLQGKIRQYLELHVERSALP